MTVFELVAKLTLDSSEYENDLKTASQESSKLSGIWGKFGTAMKVGAVAVGAASAAVVGLTKKSIDAYAEYEQLAGGIKKLYGDASDDMVAYAEQAYKTAGMTANQYMQNVTGFSAALLNSVKGDSKEAAKIADMAMQDISDNANTFGKYTAEELAGVYQALSKGQFQTLDNLNLGFGGTKEGMQSLIDKANELAIAQGESGDLQIDSYADIVKAIHLVQDDLKITGTTQAEAAKTIQGSLQMTKAAWGNFIAGLANPDADLGQLMDNLVVAIVGDKEGEGLLNQLIPAVQRAIKGIAEVIQKAAPILAEQFPALIEDVLPALLEAAATLIAGLVKALPKLIVVLVKQMPKMVRIIAKAIESADAAIFAAGKKLISKLATGITSAFGSLKNKVISLAKQIPTAIKNGVGSLVSIGRNLIEGLWSGIKGKFDSVIARVRSLAAGLPKAVKKVLGIASPSKVFRDQIGKNIALGMAAGIEDGERDVRRALDSLMGATLDTSSSISFSGSGTLDSNTNGDVFNFNLNYDADADATDMLRDLARGVQRYRMAGAI